MAEEKTFQNKVIKWLESKGAYVIKYWGGGAFTRAGVPDLLVCYNGYFIGVELKAEKGKASDLQLHNIKEIKKSGGIALVLRPSGYKEFQKFIESLSLKTFNTL